MITAKEIQQMIKEAVGGFVENLSEGAGLDKMEMSEYEMLSAKWKNPQKYGAISDYDRETLESYQSRIQQAQRGPRGASDMTPEDARFFTMLTKEKRPAEWTDEERKIMSHLRAKYKMDVDPEFSGFASSGTGPVDPVDPLAPTEEIPDDAPTVRTPRLNRENKTIDESHLRQIIKEELLVVLSDDEAVEIFGINPSDEINKKIPKKLKINA
tara:strand:- start:543 stop:1178 length:636 start_codon:yes stop_codon:yes gene_type:complete